MAEPTPPEESPTRAPEQGSRLGRAVVVVIVLGITLMWIYAFTAHPPIPGQLSDPSFAKAAEPICQATIAQLNTLPRAETTPDHVQRAAVISRANDLLAPMVDQLEKIEPASQPDHDTVAQWIGDWRTYLQNRRDYATRLAADANARFYVAQRAEDNVQITEAMDRFANPPVNDMPDCASPGDV